MNFLSNINIFFIIMGTQPIYLQIGTECLHIIWTNCMPQCVSAYWFLGNFSRHIDSFILATPHFEKAHRRISTLQSV